jgi:hypothetical protein
MPLGIISRQTASPIPKGLASPAHKRTPRRLSTPAPIPKGLYHSAQGCEQRATLGRHRNNSSATLKELNPDEWRGRSLGDSGVHGLDATPSELSTYGTAQPSVGRLRRPTLGWLIQSLRDWRRNFRVAASQSRACCPLHARLWFRDGYRQVPRGSDAPASLVLSDRPLFRSFVGNGRSGYSRRSAGTHGARRTHIHRGRARHS